MLDRLQTLAKRERKPLNHRLQGYDVPAVKHVWGVLDSRLLDREHAALRVDLFFPLLYGSAFAVSLLLAWKLWGHSFNRGWLFLPLAICLLADWTENLMQLRQLRLYRQTGPEALEPTWVRAASWATTIKLLFFIGCQILILALLVSGSPP